MLSKAEQKAQAQEQKFQEELTAQWLELKTELVARDGTIHVLLADIPSSLVLASIKNQTRRINFILTNMKQEGYEIVDVKMHSYGQSVSNQTYLITYK